MGHRPRAWPPATVRPANVPRAVDVPDRPSRVMRPAGGLPGPTGILSRLSGILPSRGGRAPQAQVGGPGRREQIYGRRCAALVLVSQPPPPPPRSPGGCGGWLRGHPRLVARPFRRQPSPRPRCHAASARPAPRPSRVPPRRAGPPVPASAPARPRPVAPPPPASASMPRGLGPPGSGPSPAFHRAPPPARSGPVHGRTRPARRPLPARAAARPPCRSGRGLQRAASMRPARLIIHIFTVPEIPYFTGFSARQAR